MIGWDTSLFRVCPIRWKVMTWMILKVKECGSVFLAEEASLVSNSRRILYLLFYFLAKMVMESGDEII